MNRDATSRIFRFFMLLIFAAVEADASSWRKSCTGSRCQIIAYVEKARQGLSQYTTMLLEVSATEVRLSALVPERYHYKFFTNKMSVQRRINGEAYVGDRDFFNLRFPVALVVDGERLATFTAVNNEQLVVGADVGKRIIPRLKAGSTLVIEYSSTLEGKGQSVRFSLAGITKALSEVGL